MNNEEHRAIIERRRDGFYLVFITNEGRTTIGPLARWDAFKLGFMLAIGALNG